MDRITAADLNRLLAVGDHKVEIEFYNNTKRAGIKMFLTKGALVKTFFIGKDARGTDIIERM